MTLSDYLQQRRGDIDAALSTLIPAPPACPQPLFEAMRYSLLAGGKRLRPILCLAGADAVGNARAFAMPAACAIELIHTYSLIHDDLPAMDDDTMRRGRPTLHVVAGEAMAILAGDGLLTEAFAILAREPRASDPALLARKLRTIAVVAEAAGAIGMVGGQVLDLSSAARNSDDARTPPVGATEFDTHALQTMHAKKTGALIRASAVSGAIMGGGNDEQIGAIDDAAADLGLAFQIIDDVLDVEGASADLGKTSGKDAAAGKLTYASLYGVERSRGMASECLARAESRLEAAGINDSRLLGIGHWIVTRSN